MASLESVKVGDVLALTRWAYGWELQKVQRLTAKQVVTDKGWRFWIESGLATGGEWWAKPATEGDVMRGRIEAAQKALNWFRVTPENVTAVEALLATPEATP